MLLWVKYRPHQGTCLAHSALPDNLDELVTMASVCVGGGGGNPRFPPGRGGGLVKALRHRHRAMMKSIYNTENKPLNQYLLTNQRHRYCVDG